MDMNEYQRFIIEHRFVRTSLESVQNMGPGLVYYALKLNGEAGEIAEKVGKALRDANGVITEEKRQAILKELGDVFWYVGAIAHELGFTLDDVANANMEKLMSRLKRGTTQGDGDDR